jgi:hypothetical protein
MSKQSERTRLKAFSEALAEALQAIAGKSENRPKPKKRKQRSTRKNQ